jgi:HSP20 family molecular chaperone IbpA
MWLICRVAFNKGKTKLLVRGVQDAEWVFCPRIRSIKNDKVTVQCCNKCAHFVRFEHNSLSQPQAWTRRVLPNRPHSLHFRKPPIKNWSSKHQTIVAPPRSMLSFKAEKQPLIDVFEEDDYVVVLAELPGMDEKDVNIEADENTLTITAKNALKTYLETVKLPTPIVSGVVKFIYKNNILQATLKKSLKVNPESYFETSS